MDKPEFEYTDFVLLSSAGKTYLAVISIHKEWIVVKALS